MIKALNWKELSQLVEMLKPKLVGQFVERVIIPERVSFPEGYLKAEWHLRLSDRKEESSFQFSLRPQNTYFSVSSGKGPKASTRATHSAFDLALSKHLKGRRILDLKAIPRERSVVLTFAQTGDSSPLGLVLVLIPASPQGYLVKLTHENGPWPVLAHSRNQPMETYTPLDGQKSPQSPPMTAPVSSLSDYTAWIEQELGRQALTARLKVADRALGEKFRLTQDRIEQNQRALKSAEEEPNWQHLGDLLKGEIYKESQEQKIGLGAQKTRSVLDYESNLPVEITCDPKLTLVEQVEVFYRRSKRKTRRVTEARERLADFQNELKKLGELIDLRPSQENPQAWQTLPEWERKVASLTGVPLGSLTVDSTTGSKSASIKAKNRWPGKSFLSRDGLMIWVGRSKDENLELTFKYARGNDLWLHLRGKPGAHVVIPLSPGKSAPLETLLDAAHLVLHYSGGASWGTTEVDYTYKKYVKRIKDSTEASYTGNKTLLIKADPVRIKRLLEP